MRYVSVCAGIEAATVAWHHMGWTPAWFSEIEPFPSAVLAHHYPEVRNLGDMTKYEEWPDEPVDLLVGGTPCQSFSVAGLRKGLSDPRGGLMLTYLEIARRYRPRWVVWENVPGVLSSNGGRDFGSFLGALGELGYGFAYRVLDAQWFGVAQRRRRVFVVGYLGDWRRAAAVLFERESVRRDTAPRREARKEVAASAAPGAYLGNAEGGAPGVPFLTCSNIASHVNNQTPLVGTFAKTHKPMSSDDPEGWSPIEASPTITHWPRDRSDAGTDVAVVQPYIQDVADPITANEGRTYTHEGNTFRTRNVQAIPIHDQATRFAGKRGDKQDGKGNGFGVGVPGDPAPTLTKGDKHVVAQPVTFGGDVARTLSARHDSSPCADRGMDVIASAMQVRRLTPTECERLQGFPDGYTNIPWRKKDEAPDGPRYKSLGNSMAVPVMRWIGERINQQDEL